MNVTSMILPLFSAAALCLPSCSLVQGEPAFRKPAKADVAGVYTVSKVSPGVPDRKLVEKAMLNVSENGAFQLNSSAQPASYRLLPPKSGNWRLVETSGIDVASGMSWGIRFQSKEGSPQTAYLLNSSPPHRILFFDRSWRGDFGDSVIFEKRQPLGGKEKTD